MSCKKPYYVLGIDLGPASCGFCLLDLANNRILEMGVHLFRQPSKNSRVSLAKVRRTARSSRRNNLRTKNRQKKILKLLQDARLVPQDADKGWFQSQKGDLPLLQLRAAGLDRKLEDREFAQVLYSLSGRRGYIPHGEVARKNDGNLDLGNIAQDTSDKDEGKVLRAVAKNEKRMQEKGYRTVGEMFSETGRSRNKKGNYDLCITNAQVKDEVRQLFEAQRAFGNGSASEELEKKYLAKLTWEKETLDHDERVYQQVGCCTYFPDEPRAARADLSSELCNAYEKFGHLVMVHSDGSEKRLSARECRQFLDVLFSPIALRGNKYCKVTYSKVRKDLDLPANVVFKGVSLKEEKDDEVYVPKAWRRLRELLPESLLRRMLEDKELADDICESLTYASTEKSLEHRLTEHYHCDLNKEELKAVKELPFSSKVFKGYARRSRKALRLLLDAFESSWEGTALTLSEAESISDLRHNPRIQRSNSLPSYSKYDPTCNNPVVLRAMGRMRHVVNSIIKQYGVPHEIHIELARKLKYSVREKKAIAKANKRREAQNKEWRSQIAMLKGCAPEDVRERELFKMSLYEEQGGKDIYTGETIELSKLFNPKGSKYYEIDHILPYSRTADDNRDNKVLVLWHTNQDKNERSPYMWMTSGEAGAPEWETYSNSVRSNNKISANKRNKLLNTMDLGSKEISEKFLNRNLNDTRYMCLAAKKYIEDSLIFPKNENGKELHVLAVAGGATAQLRHVWGLNFGPYGKKDREDDRHHAVDACVIAACNLRTIQKVAGTSKHGRNTLKQMREERLKGTQPWPGFADEVRARREFVIPTRMADHGVTGRAFQDTNYRFLGTTNDKKKLARLYCGGKEILKGNVAIGKDGNAHILDGMAFVRLWLDPTGKKGKGRWYAEPVYCADIPFLNREEYVPRFCVSGVARIAWKPVPGSAMEGEPIVIWPGDVLEVNGGLGRFSRMHIGKCSLVFLPLADDMDVKIPTLGEWNKETKVRVVQEDCLGHCYDTLRQEGA